MTDGTDGADGASREGPGARSTQKGLGASGVEAKLRSPVANSAPPPATAEEEQHPPIQIVPVRSAPTIDGWEVCPHCRTYTPSARFCSACGVAMGPLRLCEACGFRHGPKAKFCESCGAKAS